MAEGAASKAPVRLTVLGGYLGAGKTTILNHVLRNNDGRRIAVIVNDFGAINIDADLIASKDGDTVELSNGCICCGLEDGFSGALDQIRALDPPPDHLIIEVSGVGEPDKVAVWGTTPGFALDGIVVAVDAETATEKGNDRWVGDTVRAQVRSADLLLVTKADLAGPDQLARTRSWLAGIAPDTPTADVAHGEVRLDVLLGLVGDRDVATSAGSGSVGGSDEHDHVHPAYATSYATSDRPLDRTALEDGLRSLPATVVRAKGVVRLAESPDRRTVVQVVGKRVALTDDGPWPAGRERSELVVIMVGEQPIDDVDAVAPGLLSAAEAG